jgi:hypothetical protein
MSDVLDLLRSLEWCAVITVNRCTTVPGCPRCKAHRGTPHAPDCRLDRAIRELTSSAIEEVPEPTVDEMARHVDATLAGKRVGPWLTPPEPKVYEASGIVEQPPTNPSALAAWLYARVMPGRTAVEYRTAAGIVGKSLVARCYAGTDRVALGIYGGETVLVPGQGSTLLTFTRLLNPDGTVLWEAT